MLNYGECRAHVKYWCQDLEFWISCLRLDRVGYLYYNSSMKIKTSVTLSERALKALDKMAGKNGNRSALVEEAVHAYFKQKRREERDARDIELINRHADALNKEARDALLDQADFL